ncbi:hypothetical protein [Kribbella italica]|uniref:FAD/NAD(P)-binding domain-containing protein n=1 Tax=Kribbella italica TaxID=1540520 RepID=A0A7W9J648_9ACTN|nr:hypothetical protein [Kribbella italica]MBB5835840.1 hypothetical protein [Kribbella italica]
MLIRAAEVADTVRDADRFVIAAGSRPVVPSPIAESGLPYETSDSVMRIDELPPAMVVVGGALEDETGFRPARFAGLMTGDRSGGNPNPSDGNWSPTTISLPGAVPDGASRPCAGDSPGRVRGVDQVPP